MIKLRVSIVLLLSILVLSQLLAESNGKTIRASRFIEEDVQEEGEGNDVTSLEEDEEIMEDDEEMEDMEEIIEEVAAEALEEEIDEMVESGFISDTMEEVLEEAVEESYDGTDVEEIMDAVFEGDDYYGDEGNDENIDGPKPIMHTFYQRIDPEHHHTGTTANQGTGMSTDKAHLDLLATWTYAWEDAGFETKILNIEDVKNHAKYDKIRNFLDHEAFGEYDELCFLRWFAMATVGGGWMSDYDVVPLKSLVPQDYFGVPKRLSKGDMEANNGIPLPHKGQFTVYANEGRVPSLMSGSKKEWERLAQALLDLAHDHTEDFYSDMYALGDYDKKKRNAFIKESQVVFRLADVISAEGKIECDQVWKMEKEHYWTVHFSHWNINDAVEHGILDGGVTHDDRPWIAREFVEDWKKQCAESFKDSE